MLPCRPLSTVPRSPRRARGFTLIELMVAMAAGLLVALGAFLLSKSATRFFQHEARISSTHLAATLGLSRITADLQRASFHASPNVVKEAASNGICGNVPGWPAGMRLLAGIYIKRQGSVIDHAGQLTQSEANGFKPDSLVIGGSFSTTEEFHYNLIDCNDGAGCLVYIDYLSGAMGRTLERMSKGGEDLNGIFRAGRLLRIKPATQTKAMYGVIESLSITGAPPNTVFTIRVAASPDLPTFDGDCGINRAGSFNAGRDGYANPVSRVRYDLRSLAGHAAYGTIVAPISADTAQLTGDNGRTELVRVELDADNNEIADTLELVAEYAVDLKFGIAVATESGLPGVTNPVIDRYRIKDPLDPDNNTLYQIAADIGDFNAKPERIRSVEVRLTTRTRAPDRDADLGKGPDGRRYRFLIPGILPSVNTEADTPPPGAPPLYARLRTLYADVSLPNQAGVAW